MRNDEHEPRVRKNIVQEKSFGFAVKIVTFTRQLQLDRKEYVLSRQLVRSGTSIGANIEEAIAAQSKKDFLSKMSIAMKEARETHYWLRIIHQSGAMNDPEVQPLLQDCGELLKLLSSITLTTRRNLASHRHASFPDAENSSFHISHSSLRQRRSP